MKVLVYDINKGFGIRYKSRFLNRDDESSYVKFDMITCKNVVQSPQKISI